MLASQFEITRSPPEARASVAPPPDPPSAPSRHEANNGTVATEPLATLRWYVCGRMARLPGSLVARDISRTSGVRKRGSLEERERELGPWLMIDCPSCSCPRAPTDRRTTASGSARSWRTEG